MLGKYSSIMENTFILFQNGKPMVPMVTTHISFDNYVSTRSNSNHIFFLPIIQLHKILKASGKKKLEMID